MATSIVWLCGRAVCGLALVSILVLAGSFAQAAPLSSPGFLTPVPEEPDPLASATLIAGGTPEPFSGLGFSGVLVSRVYRGNTFGPDSLTFTYLLSNDAASVNALHRITVSSFETFQTDVSTRRQPTVPEIQQVLPTHADRSTPDVVGFSFLDGLRRPPVRPGGHSSLLVVETNSLSFTPSTAAVIDGSTAGVRSFAPLPAIPEPGTCALAAIGLMGVIGLVRQFRR